MVSKKNMLNILVKLPGGVIIFFIKIYQFCLSPFLGSNCKFIPTCSEYSFHAIKHYGVLRGVIISLKRILRCNPFSQGGKDYLQ